MTTLSFRADDALAARLDRVARETGSSRSELLNRALRELLYRLACERDAEIYERELLTADELVAPNAQVWPGSDDAPW